MSRLQAFCLPTFLAAASLALSACGGSGAAASSASSIAACQGDRPANVAVANTPPPAPAPPATEPNYSEVRGQSAVLDAAVGAYNEADFESAAAQFDAAAMAPGSSDTVKRVALRMLGRTRLALGDRDGAADALRRLVENEPPLVRLNPDVEPLPLLEAFYEVRRDVDGSYAVRTNRSKTLAIADFTNGSITDHAAVDPLRLGFASLMINRMSGATELELVERVRLQWLLDEQNLTRDQAGGTQAGQLLGADQVVFGTYIKNGDRMIMTARVVDVATTAILPLNLRVEGEASQFDALVSCLSDLVAEAVDVRLPAAPTSQAAESLDAVIAYARGLALEETEDFAGAAEQYQLALSIDPQYAPAQQRMSEGLVPMVASNM